jgi:hypothetical protein
MNITKLMALDLNSGICREKYTHPNNAAIAAKRLQHMNAQLRLPKTYLCSQDESM